jgi:hypothetical protein
VTCASGWNYIPEYYYDARTHKHKIEVYTVGPKGMKLIWAAERGTKWKRWLDVLGAEVKKKDIAKLEVLYEG